MNEKLTALCDEVRSFFMVNYSVEIGDRLAFLLKKCKIFRLFVYIYREKSKLYSLIAFEFGNILLVIKHLEEGYGNHSFISWRS